MKRSATCVALASAVGVGWVASLGLVPPASAAKVAERPLAARPAVRTAYLTHLAGQAFSIRRTASSDTVRDAPGNTDQNIRVVWWNANETPALDESACTSFKATDATYNPTLLQEGVALRVRRTPYGLTALTVTKNVFSKAIWEFNVTWWVVAANGVTTYARLAYFDMQHALSVAGQLAPEPWSLCARVTGATLTALVWPTSESMPAWDSPVDSATTTLPTAWVYPGVAGWYAGHVRRGSTIVYTRQAVTSVP